MFESWLLNGIVAYIGLFVVSFIWKRIRQPGLNVKGKHIFVTGGSTGLGLAIAKRLAEAGANLTIIARNADKLAKAKETLSAIKGAGKVFTSTCDVSDNATVEYTIEEAIEHHSQPIDWVICCAGIALPGYFVDCDIATHRKAMEVNYFGALHVIQGVVPKMIENKIAGHIVLINSAVSFCPMIGYSTYAPSKYALRGLGDCLRNELQLYNIKTTNYFPANIETPGFEQENKTKPAETKKIEGSVSLVSAESAADALLAGIRKGDYSITNDTLAELGRIATNGISPNNNLLLELLLAPFCPIIAAGFAFFADSTVRSSPKVKRD
eukprot:m.62678 g.62678  ORF g.62678 m.62678 type:complete len:324 (-) comp19391_c0_seq1:79-1050(-)